MANCSEPIYVAILSSINDYQYRNVEGSCIEKFGIFMKILLYFILIGANGIMQLHFADNLSAKLFQGQNDNG